MDPADFNPKKDLKGKAKETEAFESWVDSIVDEGGIKPYVSMSRGEDNGKMRYNVLDRNEKTIFSSVDQEEAQDFLRQNFDKLRAGEMEVAAGGVDTVDVDEYATEPKDQEIEKKDKENATKLDVTKADKMMNTTAYKKMKAGDPKYADKTEGMGDKIADMAQSMSKDEFMSKADELGLTPEEAAEHYEKMQGGAHAGKFEGNQFAQAVQKAKAAGMKAGDKFKVGDDEYTLKDAIEMAGLDLNEFYSEEEFAMENSNLTSAYKQIAQLASDVDENPEDAEDQWELSSEVARPITKILKQIMDYNKGEQMPDGSDMSYPDVFKKVSMLANKGAQTNDPKMAAEIFKTMSNVYDMKQVAEESVAEDPELARIKKLAFYQ